MKIKEAIQENQKIYGIRNIIVRMNSSLIQNNNTDKKDNKVNNKNNKHNNFNKMSNKSTAFMAFSKGKESAETFETKLYWGYGNCNIVAINPNKAQLEKLYGRTMEKEPVYLSEAEVNGVKVPQTRIDIFYKLDPEKHKDDNGKSIDTIFRKSYFLTKVKQSNRDMTKYHITDEYGNTAWATTEQVTNHEIPMYSNGPANISKNYKVLYRGEESLMNLFKTFLGVTTIRVNAEQKPTKYNNALKAWEVVSNEVAAEGLCGFDKIDDYFKGDFSELNTLHSYQPNNKVKLLFGVKHIDGKEYQDIYDVVLYPNQKNTSKFEEDVKKAQDSGAYPNTVFKFCELREYSVEATDFTNTPTSSNPFETTENEDIFA